MYNQALSVGQPHADTITILHAQSSRAKCAKVLHADGTTAQKVNPGSLFLFENYPLSDLADLHALLQKLQSDQRAFIIRGSLHPDRDLNQPQPRRLSHVEDKPHHWLCLDFDEIEAPPGLEPTDPASVALLVRERLPTEFHHSAFIIQWSSSAGTPKAGRLVKAHVWFWLATVASCASLKPWVASIGADPALFTPVQPHYTASTVFLD